MTDRTPEQVAADNAIEDAIAASVKAYDLVEEAEILTTWCVVGAAQGVDEGRTSYFHLLPGGTQQSHVTIGLLRIAEDQLLHSDDE